MLNVMRKAKKATAVPSADLRWILICTFDWQRCSVLRTHPRCREDQDMFSHKSIREQFTGKTLVVEKVENCSFHHGKGNGMWSFDDEGSRPWRGGALNPRMFVRSELERDLQMLFAGDQAGKQSV